ncbi:MAG: manganese efflux pump [Clostridiales bacterium]|nr:manganese efflux pump [Clostridiales bacterium]
MNFFELLFISIGLSCDAFAAAICKGFPIKKVNIKNAGIVGLYFGGFQALMPLIGYYLGVQFQETIAAFDHWIAFILLGLLGINMIRESTSNKDDNRSDDQCLNSKNMFVLAVATSIDALAVGITFAFLRVNILPAASFIGLVTFALSVIGVKIGNVFGLKYKSKAELFGGLILIVIGIKILLEHTILS